MMGIRKGNKHLTNKIIFLGPYGSGKSALANEIEEKSGGAWMAKNLDGLANYYLRSRFPNPGPHRKRYDDWGLCNPRRQVYDAYFVESFLAEFGYCDDLLVLAFGASHCVFQDETCFDKINSLLAPFPYVFWVQPLQDLEESLNLLFDQIRRSSTKGRDFSDDRIIEINRCILDTHSKRPLTTKYIFTDGKTPSQTVNELEIIVPALASSIGRF